MLRFAIDKVKANETEDGLRPAVGLRAEIVPLVADGEPDHFEVAVVAGLDETNVLEGRGSTWDLGIGDLRVTFWHQNIIDRRGRPIKTKSGQASAGQVRYEWIHCIGFDVPAERQEEWALYLELRRSWGGKPATETIVIFAPAPTIRLVAKTLGTKIGGYWKARVSPSEALLKRLSLLTGIGDGAVTGEGEIDLAELGAPIKVV